MNLFNDLCQWPNLSVAGDVLNERIRAGHIHKAAMRAVVNPSMIKAVLDDLLEIDDLIAPVASFLSDCVEKKAIHVKNEKEISKSKIKVSEVSPSLPTSAFLTMTTYHPAIEKKRSRWNKKSPKKSSLTTRTLMTICGAWRREVSLKGEEDLSSSWRVRKQNKDRISYLKVLLPNPKAFARPCSIAHTNWGRNPNNTIQKSRLKLPNLLKS